CACHLATDTSAGGGGGSGGGAWARTCRGTGPPCAPVARRRDVHAAVGAANDGSVGWERVGCAAACAGDAACTAAVPTAAGTAAGGGGANEPARTWRPSGLR